MCVVLVCNLAMGTFTVCMPRSGALSPEVPVFHDRRQSLPSCFIPNFVSVWPKRVARRSFSPRHDLPAWPWSVTCSSNSSSNSTRTCESAQEHRERFVPPLPKIPELPFMYWYTFADRRDEGSFKKATKKNRSTFAKIVQEEIHRKARFSKRRATEIVNNLNTEEKFSTVDDSTYLGKKRSRKPSSLTKNKIDDGDSSIRDRDLNSLKVSPFSGQVKSSRLLMASDDQHQARTVATAKQSSLERSNPSDGEIQASKVVTKNNSLIEGSTVSAQQKHAITAALINVSSTEGCVASSNAHNQASTVISENESSTDGLSIVSGIENPARQVVADEAISDEELQVLLQRCRCKRSQLNIGCGGWGLNMKNLVNSYWKKSPLCKVVCKGIVTVDMDFMCEKLEARTGGKVVYRVGGVVYLYRGRSYNWSVAPRLPVLHRHQRFPPLPKRLHVPLGLTKEDIKEMCARGREIPAICKLGINFQLQFNFQIWYLKGA